MLPGIGRQSSQSFCHRIFGNNTCGSNGWQCLSCDSSKKQELRELEERKNQHLRELQEQRELMLRIQEIEQQQQRARDEENRRRIEAEEARLAQEAEKMRHEQQQKEAEKKKAQQRLEEARREEERQKLAAAQATAKQAAETLHKQLLKDKADAVAAAEVVAKQLAEWAEIFCAGRWIQMTAKGPHFNKYALVMESPSNDGFLAVLLFTENVRFVVSSLFWCIFLFLKSCAGQIGLCRHSPDHCQRERHLRCEERLHYL